MAPICCWKIKGAETNDGLVLGNGPKRFSHRELAQATGEFTVKLGQGGFGIVYKGVLENPKMQVAVKRLSKASDQGNREFESEVNIISQLGHKHLVKLIGWCQEKGELLIVYEFMENGSLDMHLFKGKSLLAWGVRYNIATGLALALRYLHEEGDKCVLHRDIKSSNIMLDSNFNMKLSDFGLARLVDHAKDLHTMTKMAGTFAYMAPEYSSTNKASKKTDVYSFGVVALEIACGKKPTNETGTLLIDTVWDLYWTDNLLKAVDPLLGSDYDEEEIRRLMTVGLWCVHAKSADRPEISEVIAVLEKKAPEPTKSKMNTQRSQRSLSLKNPTIMEGQSSSSEFKTAQSSILPATKDAPPAPLSTWASLPSNMQMLIEGQSSSSEFKTAQSNLSSIMPATNDATPAPLSTWPSFPSNMPMLIEGQSSSIDNNTVSPKLPSKTPVTYNRPRAPLYTGKTV